MNLKVIVGGIVLFVVALAGWGISDYLDQAEVKFKEQLTRSLVTASGMKVSLSGVEFSVFDSKGFIETLTISGTASDKEKLLVFNDVEIEVKRETIGTDFVKIKNVTVGKATVNTKDTSVDLLSLSKHMLEIAKNPRNLVNGPKVTVDLVSFPGGSYTLRKRLFGQDVETTRDFHKLELSAMGVRENGVPVDIMVYRILLRFINNAQGIIEVPNVPGIQKLFGKS